MYKKAIEQALQTTKANIERERFGDKFPHVGINSSNQYELIENEGWTEGFWPGILWLSYEYSGNGIYREAAVKTVNSLRNRLQNNWSLDHHDIGFLYSLSSKAQWIVEGNEDARQAAIQAADVLMKRWRGNMNILQAWGREGDPDNGGRIIIDCLMNLPLLHWAYKQTGNESYREVADKHTEASRRYLVRGDDSSYHTFWFDPATGDSHRGGTHQGYKDGSTWTRGQAWGIYGFALAYRYLQKPEYLETAKRLAVYFADRIPEDGVVYWDFDAPQVPETKRDSSASAIAACGMLEVCGFLSDSDPAYNKLMQAVNRSIEGLANDYSTKEEDGAEGLLNRGSYSVRSGSSPDDYTIWGDYFYLEALMRLEKGIPGYWYER
ncbi:glycoside hydrolase family 88 protein [Paenibacillus glycanilyticus]|uniref:Unsaturated chondroitin disaccharide hydrolase n=1 Tax=Paenibacillus glycanilyticus TaxID=126569 RepID=A0ABQ6G7T9_9BACL|nr:glycoside hydrolase family 88 protein [Paenibacillus glycanilyticus]GLX66657.1 unsaturated chondroitin disaccharide hydrolase [Paenibacillus glycanilyticus]